MSQNLKLQIKTDRRVHCQCSNVVFQFFSCLWLFVIKWTAAWQAFLSFTISWSLPKLMSIEAMMPSNHLILCYPFSSFPQTFPASGSFPMSQLFALGGHYGGIICISSAYLRYHLKSLVWDGHQYGLKWNKKWKDSEHAGRKTRSPVKRPLSGAVYPIHFEILQKTEVWQIPLWEKR